MRSYGLILLTILIMAGQAATDVGLLTAVAVGLDSVDPSCYDAPCELGLIFVLPVLCVVSLGTVIFSFLRLIRHQMKMTNDSESLFGLTLMSWWTIRGILFIGISIFLYNTLSIVWWPLGAINFAAWGLDLSITVGILIAVFAGLDWIVYDRLILT